ncbi:MAG: hypothetical protein OXI51_05150 [Chloroflexota bacterium]|nr:hypothetical protein [Chloroflexota bacterium]MDE2669025.1 hypothetical protein [Chloroflexota bacterium]
MSTERRQTDHHEELRIEGLRALARVIVRHALANPDREPDPPEESAGAPVRKAAEPGGEGGAP